MRKIPPVFATLGLIAYSANLDAQHESCGTTVTEETMAYFAQTAEARANMNVSMRSGSIQLPIKVHVVRYSDGTGGISHNALYDELQTVNALFAPGGVQFFLCAPPEYINDDYFTDMMGEKQNEIGDAYDQDSVLNIYFVPRLLDAHGENLCGLSRHFELNVTKQWDKVFVSQLCATNGSTLAHEIGHYLSLLHTHSGNAPVNGSGCNLNGDQICDTPADPMLIGLVNDDCDYVGSITDQNGDPYHPLTNNIMSYAPASCRDAFTQTQLNRILFSATYERSYLASNDTFHLDRLPDYTELPVRLSPNPTADFTQVTVDEVSDPGQFLNVAVYNLRGEEVHRETVDNDHRDEALSLDLTRFEKGIYFVSVSDGHLTGTQKLIIP